MTFMKPHRLIPALLLSAPLLAACGSSSAPGSSAGSDSASTKGVAFAQCMRSHGVPNFPDPSSNGHGGLRYQATQRAGSGPSLKINGVSVNAPAFQSAQQACRSLLPNGGQPKPLSASQRQAMLRFSQCMRNHGLSSFPDPTFNGAAVGIRLRAGNIDPNSPAFKAAQTACAQYQRQAFGTQIGPGG